MKIVLFTSTEGNVHEVNEVLFEPFWFGVIALGAFAALLVLLWTFRNTLALDPVPHDHPAGHDPVVDGQSHPGH